MLEKTCEISSKDFVSGEPIFALIDKFFGLDLAQNGVKRRQRLVNLALLVIMPFAILGPITLVEGNFWYGSVRKPLECYGDAVGMSFLGDTMVWPFNIIVPLCIILVSLAVARSQVLFETVFERASIQWKNDNTKLGLKKTLLKCKRILDYKMEP